MDAATLERALLAWQEQLLGPAHDNLVIVDGKTLQHAHPPRTNVAPLA